jgi:hypothetical protein
MGVSGFRVGRRYVNLDSSYLRYFTMYEADDLGVFTGEEYVSHLNSPTPWTQKMMPHLRNFRRIVCEVLLSEGEGVGGAIATVSFEAAEQRDSTQARELAGKLLGTKGIVGVHLAAANSAASELQTKEKMLRQGGKEAWVSTVLLVEGHHLHTVLESVSKMQDDIRSALSVRGEMEIHGYPLAYLVRSRRGQA